VVRNLAPGNPKLRDRTATMVPVSHALIPEGGSEAKGDSDSAQNLGPLNLKFDPEGSSGLRK